MAGSIQSSSASEEVVSTEILQNATAPIELDTLQVSRDELTASSPSQQDRRSSRGSIATTYQVGLKSASLISSSNRNGATPKPPFNADAFHESENVVELQPMDKGFGAWSYVAAAFAMYIVVWGFPQAFPIFQTYLSTGPTARYPDSPAIRLLAPGLQDIEEGIIFPLLPTAAKFRRLLVIIGIFIITISLLLASYCEKDWQIVLTQGVSFGIGGILLNFVHVSVFPEWFDKKKGQAMGMVWMGWRVGALAFPLICQWLLHEHGFEQSLRVLIAPMLSLLVPSILLLRGRYRTAAVTSKPMLPSVSKLQALRAPSVLYCLFATVPFFLVVNVPKMFITTFAADLGMSGSDQAFALVFLVLSDMLGTYLCGYFSDTFHYEVMTASLSFATALSHILGLGLARSRAGVYVYAATVGLASGGFSNCLYGFFGDAANGNVELFTAIHGLFSFFRGAAILSVGPVGAELLQRAPVIDTTAFAISRYQVSHQFAHCYNRMSTVLTPHKIVSFGVFCCS